ncbi:hypothetical protein [Actinacidiphila paucisporea]|uniref:Uncharacterized protein n=1 Tax=Actinacidiphila paucisporea TaxID=310782 RepID=A0A1M7MZL3_9ACTN|nr:hypothetical protein [Actinacidiphila paucisporea]SHM96539.1 hypothetical protein SAMN05216499_11760 [Actinacidiphila paucisporea]
MSTQEDAEGRPAPFLVAAVGKRASFHRTVTTALRDLVRDSGRLLDEDDPGQAARALDAPAYGQVLDRSRRFLDAVLPDAGFRLVKADSLTGLGHTLQRRAAGPGGPQAPALLLIDAAAAGVGAAPLDRELQAALDQLGTGPEGAAGSGPSGCSVVVYEAAVPDTVHVASPFTHRLLPEQDWVLAGDIVCCLTDALQLRQSAAALRAASRAATCALAAALAGFLNGEAGAAWGLHYYTGSAVSGLIGDLEEIVAGPGNPVLRGPSEHSLACGALARWQVDGAPALIVATSGMVDEFRGTLANLREARARGFIVCADSPAGAWYPFQGTVHAAEDSREVLRARRLPYFYLDDPGRLDQDLAAAFEAYGQDRGPVVLLATPEVLRVPAGAAPPPRPAAVRPRAAVTEDALAPVMDIINNGPAHVLWQCGAVDAEQRGLVHEIAAAAGVALADSLTRPGTVAGHHEGRRVEEYLGTLGMYGYSARVHDYLHEGGRLRGRDRQALFFLNSRIAEAATPFAARTLNRMLRIVQVTREAGHLAPFADHPVHAEGADFLREVRRRLAVPERLRAERRAALARTADSPSDVVHLLPVAPMSANYFFHRLAAVLDDLITRHGYTYTGVYDVGRGGLSAIRNLPRTGPGFSGWYGRALMGDALSAVPALALTREGNVLAFVGDGAAALVPDMVPTLVEHICLDGRRPARNVSVFRLIDGGHSVIRTYREGRSGAAAARQTRILHLLDDEREQSFGPVTVSRRRLTGVDPDALRDQLTRPATVNLYSVLLAHNNEGDGLSLLSSLGWQRDHLSDLALAMGGTPRPAARRSTR